MKFLFTAFLLLSAIVTTTAQESIVSPSINISNEGWNKIVQMKDGNTLLFHFELKHNVVVKVFDKAGKENASKKDDLKLIDVNQLDKALFEGLYAINGEAVLFVTQQVDNVRTLVRIRYNGATGDMINEERLVKSANFTKETVAKVLRTADEPGYHVACYTHTTLDTITDIKLINYNEKHEVENEMPYVINSSKQYDFVRLVNTSIDRTGNILICTELSKIIQYPSLFDRTLLLLYLPKGEKNFVTNKLLLPQKLKIASEEFTVNSFAGKINMFVDKTWDATDMPGDKKYGMEYMVQSLFIIPEDVSGLREAPLKHDTANELLRNVKNNPEELYYGSILKTYTSDAGKTTVVYEDNISIDQKTILRNANTQCAANLCIAQYDDNGKEIWSTILPKSHYYAPVGSHPTVFGKLSEAEQHTTVCMSNKKGHYMLFNDPDENFDKTLKDPLKPIFTYDKTNAVYYHINKKNEVTKRYLLAKTSAEEYQYIYPGSAYYDEHNNTIAALMRSNNGKESALHLVWSKLEE